MCQRRQTNNRAKRRIGACCGLISIPPFRAGQPSLLVYCRAQTRGGPAEVPRSLLWSMRKAERARASYGNANLTHRRPQRDLNPCSRLVTLWVMTRRVKEAGVLTGLDDRDRRDFSAPTDSADSASAAVAVEVFDRAGKVHATPLSQANG